MASIILVAAWFIMGIAAGAHAIEAGTPPGSVVLLVSYGVAGGLISGLMGGRST